MEKNSGDSDKKYSIDIHSAEFARDPYPEYEHLRAECPVMHSELYGPFWMLTRYEDVRQAAMDWRTYTSSVVGVTAIPVITTRTEPQLPIELDPPLHSQHRTLVNPVFSAQRIETLRRSVETLVDSLVDGLLAQKQVDLVANFAIPLSVGTLALFTGLPHEDSARWISWIRRMFNVKDRADGAIATQEFGAYIDTLIAERRNTPTDDFISMLMNQEVDGHRLTDKELHSFCTVVFGAGFETTADALSVMFYWLAEHPDDYARLRTEPTLIASAVEEFLRYSTPIQIFGRNATHDLHVHDTDIPSGGIVALAFGSANHDPAVFAQPEQCLLERSPNRHVAFGAGPHLCLGAPVARLELEVTLKTFTKRVAALKSLEPVAWKTRGDRRGIVALPVTLEPA